VVRERRAHLVDAIHLQCPDCLVEFDFNPPTLKYLEPGLKRDFAPARCPNGHVHLYDITTGKPRSGG
jgi:hypothetical protein